MAKFELYTNQGEKITTTEHKSMKEALQYHSKLKQLPLDLFIKMFRVEEIPGNDNFTIDENGKRIQNETRSTKS